MKIAIIVLYALVAGSCIWAWRCAATDAREWRDQSKWLLVALLFMVLILLRAFDVEVAVRAGLRDLARERGLYSERRTWQGPLAAMAILCAAGVFWYALRSWSRIESRTRLYTLAASLAALGYLPLYALRIISLHFTDRLLYSGPLRLNWLVDVGLAFVIGTASVLFMHRLGARRHTKSGRSDGGGQSS